jgi:hypothetical protein
LRQIALVSKNNRFKSCFYEKRPITPAGNLRASPAGKNPRSSEFAGNSQMASWRRLVSTLFHPTIATKKRHG